MRYLPQLFLCLSGKNSIIKKYKYKISVWNIFNIRQN
nr:MAG TPA: hypothetical protein [Bacteriophage sp.]DAT92678.1 MAG TPA: hypothetical protein [Herelleviridae sp.]